MYILLGKNEFKNAIKSHNLSKIIMIDLIMYLPNFN